MHEWIREVNVRATLSQVRSHFYKAYIGILKPSPEWSQSKSVTDFMARADDRQNAGASALRSRREFASVAAKLAAGVPVAAEVNGRRINVVGTTTIGASFAVDGNLVTSDSNFRRLLPGRPPGSIDVGVIRLRPRAKGHALRTQP